MVSLKIWNLKSKIQLFRLPVARNATRTSDIARATVKVWAVTKEPLIQAPARKATNDRVNKRYGNTGTARRRTI